MRQLRIIQSITARDNKCLEKYLSEISRESILTPNQEIILAQKIRQGDLDAMQKLIRGNLRFVVSVAKQYQNQGFSLSDLINEGNIGLIKAAQKFDETKGFKFISYAVWWIRQSIMMALADKTRLVRLPFNQVSTLGKIKRLQIRFQQEHQRDASDEEISEELHIKKDAIKDAIVCNMKPVMLDSPLDNEEGSASLMEITEDITSKPADNELSVESIRYDIRCTLNHYLKPREREIVKLFYGLDLTEPLSIEQIADRLEITRERVRQVKEKAIKKLKYSPRTKNLRLHLA